MKTPLLPIFGLLGLGVLGLNMVYTGVLQNHSRSAPATVVITLGGLLLMLLASTVIWKRLDTEQGTTDADADDLDQADEQVALCTTCLDLVNPLDHYCPKCGEAVGRYTGYMPFVNIPFDFNFVGRLWHRAFRDPGIPLLKRACYFTTAVAIAPIMLIGLPFVLLDRMRPRRKEA